MAIAESMAGEFLMEHGVDPRESPQAFERLRIAAEKVKMGLSLMTHHAIELDDIMSSASGTPLSLSFSMSRGEFDELTRPIILKTFEVCNEAMRIARMHPRDFPNVLLVGGSTRISLVREQVKLYFGTEPQDRVHPDEVVAIGAGIQAAALRGENVSRIHRPPIPARTSAVPRHKQERHHTTDMGLGAIEAERNSEGPTAPRSGGAERGTVPPPLPKRGSKRASPRIVQQLPDHTKVMSREALGLLEANAGKAKAGVSSQLPLVHGEFVLEDDSPNPDPDADLQIDVQDGAVQHRPVRDDDSTPDSEPPREESAPPPAYDDDEAEDAADAHFAHLKNDPANSSPPDLGLASTGGDDAADGLSTANDSDAADLAFNAALEDDFDEQSAARAQRCLDWWRANVAHDDMQLPEL